MRMNRIYNPDLSRTLGALHRHKGFLLPEVTGKVMQYGPLLAGILGVKIINYTYLYKDRSKDVIRCRCEM